MAVSVVGTPTSGNTAAGTSNSLPTSLPSGWAAGDVAVLVGHVSGGSLNMSTPAGWTSLPGVSWPVTESGSSRMYAWSRVLQSGDSAPTIAINGAMTGGWELLVFRDVTGVAQAATATASGTSVTLPTLTGVAAGSALVAASHVRVASGTIPTNLSPAGAYTEVVDHATSRATGSANLRMGAAWRLVGASGSYGGEAVGSDVTGSMIGLLLELAAASVDATVSPDGMSVPVEVGAPSVAGGFTVAPVGVSAPAAVGSPAVDGSLGASPAGLAAAVAVGSAGASWAVSAAPDGVSAAVSLAGPEVGWSGDASPDGVTVAAAVGEPGVGWSATAGPSGVAVPATVGGPAAGWVGVAEPDGAGVPVEVGEPGLPDGAATMDGLSVPVAVGGPSAVWSVAAAPAGLSAPVAVGSPGASWPDTVAPGGVPVPVAAGAPRVVWTRSAAPAGVSVAVVVGGPSVGWSTVVVPAGVVLPVVAAAPSLGPTPVPGGPGKLAASAVSPRTVVRAEGARVAATSAAGRLTSTAGS